jgi:glycine cleavage system H lipoate-binding protein
MVGILLVVTLLAFFLVDLIVLRVQKRRAWPWQVPAESNLAVDPAYCPADRFYAPNHTWFKIQPDGRIRLGLDAFLLYTVGVPESVELARADAMVKGEPFLHLRAKGRELSIPAALAGRVTAINQAVLREPRQLTEEGDGNWVVEIETEAVGEAAGRMRVAERASQWIRSEIGRLKEFALRVSTPEAAWAESAADGGVPVPALLQNLEEPAWREFETNFLHSDE